MLDKCLEPTCLVECTDHTTRLLSHLAAALPLHKWQAGHELQSSLYKLHASQQQAVLQLQVWGDSAQL